MGLSVDSEGRLVVDEEESDEDESEEKPKMFSLGQTPGVSTGSAKGKKTLSSLRALRERKRLANVERRGLRTKGLNNFAPGKKAQGDVMRKGAKHEPFAYVSLNPKLSKERHKGKVVQSLKGIVKGAKKGTLRGQKAHKQQILRSMKKDRSSSKLRSW